MFTLVNVIIGGLTYAVIAIITFLRKATHRSIFADAFYDSYDEELRKCTYYAIFWPLSVPLVAFESWSNGYLVRSLKKLGNWLDARDNVAIDG